MPQTCERAPLSAPSRESFAGQSRLPHKQYKWYWQLNADGRENIARDCIRLLRLEIASLQAIIRNRGRTRKPLLAARIRVQSRPQEQSLCEHRAELAARRLHEQHLEIELMSAKVDALKWRLTALDLSMVHLLEHAFRDDVGENRP